MWFHEIIIIILYNALQLLFLLHFLINSNTSNISSNILAKLYISKIVFKQKRV